MAKIVWTLNGKKLPWPPKPFPGYPTPIWELKSAYIKNFVAKHSLVPAKQEIKIDEKTVSHIPLWWKFGGPWGPHLHLGEDIYMLDKSQWQEFSQGLAQEMDLKIKGAGAVKFEAVMKAAIEADLFKGAK